MPDSGHVLPLALLHLIQPLAVLLDRSPPVLRGHTKIRSRRSNFKMPGPARRLQRGLETMSRTSPILVASSTNGRVSSTCLRQNFQLRKKTRFSARSHVVTFVLAASGMAVWCRVPSAPRAGFNHHPSLRSSPDILASLDHSPGCRSAYAATFKYLSVPPVPPRLAAGQQHNLAAQNRDMWGGGVSD